MSRAATVSGRMILYNESPLDFKAVNSLFSAKFPNVIMDDRSIAKGSASGIKLADIYRRSSRIIPVPSPLPIKSSRYFQKNCITSINIEIASVTTNGPAKDFILNKVNFFKELSFCKFNCNNRTNVENQGKV